MKIRILAVLILFLTTGLLRSQTYNLRFSTYFYSWQRSDSNLTDNTIEKTTHVRGYQNLLLDASKDKWSFNTLLQTEEDVINRIDGGFNYRFYNLYVKGTNLFNRLDAKLGRQYIFGGVGKGAVDGLYLKFKAGKNKEYQVSGYGGGLTPLDYSFKNYPSLKYNFMFGGQFNYFGVRDLEASVSYSNKHNKPDPYYGLRLDSLFNTQQVWIDIDPISQQYAGFDFNYTYKLKHSIYGKAYYDINLRRLYRAELNARVRVIDNLNVNAGYIYHQPQISYNTIFWVFESKPNQEIEGGVDYTLKNGMNLYATVSNVMYTNEDDTLKNNSLRFIIGFNNPAYGLSYIKYTGYSGESDGLTGYFSRELVKDKLSGSVSLSYSNYSLDEFSTDKVNSLSGLISFTYRPVPQFSVDIEGQFIKNRIYKYDSRFLLGISYWMFKKL
jgi:hypothetical protein